MEEKMMKVSKKTLTSGQKVTKDKNGKITESEHYYTNGKSVSALRQFSDIDTMTEAEFLTAVESVKDISLQVRNSVDSGKKDRAVIAFTFNGQTTKKNGEKKQDFYFKKDYKNNMYSFTVNKSANEFLSNCNTEAITNKTPISIVAINGKTYNFTIGDFTRGELSGTYDARMKIGQIRLTDKETKETVVISASRCLFHILQSIGVIDKEAVYTW